MKPYCETLGAGPDIAILPGGPGLSLEYLKKGLQGLANGFTLHFLDYPGCGGSRPWPRNVTFSETVAAVQEVLFDRFEGKRFFILAHSFGATILGELLASNAIPTMDRCVLVTPAPHTLSKFLEALNNLTRRMSSDDLALFQALMSGQIEAPLNFQQRLMAYYCGRNDNLPSLSLGLDAQTCGLVCASLPQFDHRALFEARRDALYILGSTDFIGSDLFADDPNFAARSQVLTGGHFIFSDAEADFMKAVGTHFLA